LPERSGVGRDDYVPASYLRASKRPGRPIPYEQGLPEAEAQGSGAVSGALSDALSDDTGLFDVALWLAVGVSEGGVGGVGSCGGLAVFDAVGG
jgi:hypothetical protein